MNQALDIIILLACAVVIIVYGFVGTRAVIGVIGILFFGKYNGYEGRKSKLSNNEPYEQDILRLQNQKALDAVIFMGVEMRVHNQSLQNETEKRN